MTGMLIVGSEPARIDGYALALAAQGHEVGVCHGQASARARLSGEAPRAVVVDVVSPDGGDGLLVGQARTA